MYLYIFLYNATRSNKYVSPQATIINNIGSIIMSLFTKFLSRVNVEGKALINNNVTRKFLENLSLFLKRV